MIYLAFRILMRRRAQPSRFQERLDGVIRVVVCVTLVSLGLSALTLRKSWAKAGDSGLQMGSHLLDLKDVLGPRQAVTVNGVTVYVGSKHVELSLNEALDRFERHCTDHDGGFTREFAALPLDQQVELAPYVKDARHLGTIRSQHDTTEGLIACVAMPEGASGFRGLAERAQVFVETGDLASIGELRYAFARRGKASGTDVLTMWTEGPFNISNFLFSDGDAPGRDTPDVPRPDGSLRFFSADVRGSPYALRLFSTRQPASEVVQKYDVDLPHRGWLPLPTTNVEDEATFVRVFTKDNAAVFLSAQSDKAETVLQIVELGAPTPSRLGGAGF